MSKYSSIWTANLGVLNGTRFEVHITCLLLLGFFASDLVMDEVPAALVIVGFIINALCLILHEIAHLIPLRGKAQTLHLKFYSFGALRAIGFVGHKDKAISDQRVVKSFYSSLLFGPICNAVLAFAFYQLYLLTLEIYPSPLSRMIFGISEFNFFLALVNLLPILPLDLGQFYKMKLEKNTTDYYKFIQITHLASWLFFLYAIISKNIPLILVASHALIIMVQESFISKAAKTLANSSIREAMLELEKVQVLPQAMSIASAADITTKTFQNFFPVKNHENVVGFVSKDSILQAFASGAEDTLGSILQKDFLKVQVSDSIVNVLRKLDEFGTKVLFVFSDEKPVGFLFKDKLHEYLMISSIKNRNEQEIEF